MHASRVLHSSGNALKRFAVDAYTNTSPHFAVTLPTWQRLVGERVIGTLNLDMDKVRAGPIAGAVFRDWCKGQGLYEIRGGKLVEGQKLAPRPAFYYEYLSLPQTFQQWYQICNLHMWMLYVRLRTLPRQYCREYQKKLLDSIMEDIALRLAVDMKINSDRQINSYKKQFNEQFRGAVFSYDEALVLGDAEMAAALWRNLYGSKQDVDMVHLEQLVHYVRAQLYLYSHVSDRDFATGRIGFLEPWARYETLSKTDLEEIRVAEHENDRNDQSDDASHRSMLSTESKW